MSPGIYGSITIGRDAQNGVPVTIINPATPKIYTTGIVITIERQLYDKKLFDLPLQILNNVYATGQEKMKPPVGPSNLPNPDVPPTKTGKPTVPSSTYTINTINVSLGDSNKPVKVATNVNAVTIAGLNGNGNEIHADTHKRAVNKAIFVKRLASIIYLIHIKS